MPIYNIIVKGYKPRCCELQMQIEAPQEDMALEMAVATANTGDYFQDAHFNNAVTEIIWEEAELADEEE